jgi:hypothetical protein
MTHNLTKLEALVAKLKLQRWLVERDAREGMEWNNHIVSDDGNTVCFMAHSGGTDDEGDEAKAELIAEGFNALPSLIAAAKAGERMREALGRITALSGPTSIKTARAIARAALQGEEAGG